MCVLAVLVCALTVILSAVDPQRPARPVALGGGKLLVASRGLTDPNFARSVILLFEHNAAGAAGLIVNVRTTATLATLFGHLNLPPEPPTAAYFGGPVARETALALVRSSTSIADARLIARDVYLVAHKDGLEKRLASRADAREFRVYLGYAGWSAGQLEREMALNAWHVLDATADVVFDPNSLSVWQRQIRRTELLQALMTAVARLTA